VSGDAAAGPFHHGIRYTRARRRLARDAVPHAQRDDCATSWIKQFLTLPLNSVGSGSRFSQPNGRPIAARATNQITEFGLADQAKHSLADGRDMPRRGVVIAGGWLANSGLALSSVEAVTRLGVDPERQSTPGRRRK